MDKEELEAKAERAVRRGELQAAVGLYQQLAATFPNDARLRQRALEVQQSLQPLEVHGFSGLAPSAEVDLRVASPEQEGERLFAIGDYVGAAAAYRRALEARPESELVRERLEELYRLARSAPQASPTDQALPAERQALLQALLDRISSRRRVRSRGAP